MMPLKMLNYFNAIVLLALMGCSHTPTSMEGPQVEVAKSSDPGNGSIDREEIRQVIQKNIGKFKGCYEKALNRNAKLAGKLVLEWTILVGGDVLSEKVLSSTLKDKAFESCSLTALHGLKFPSPPQGQIAIVSYPFVYKARK